MAVSLKETGRWAKVEDGQIISIGPRPDSWENPNKTTTTASPDTEVSAKTLAKAGYFPVVTSIPEPLDTEYPTTLEVVEHQVQKNRVVEVLHHVEQRPTPDALDEWKRNVEERYQTIEDRYTEARDLFAESLAKMDSLANLAERVRLQSVDLDRILRKAKEAGLA